MHRHGFSLLELSIVLVIIGLIAGGIVAGASMIRAAELRAVITEQQKIKIAMHTFRDKYFALPGDMKNAVRFWGAAAGGTADGVDATCVALDHTSPSTGTETCNGNGDGYPYNGTTGNEIYERYRFWQHLVNAGLINGSYTGVHGSSGTYHHVAGENSYGSKMGNNAWGMASRSTSLTGNVNNYDISSYIVATLRDDSQSGYINLFPEEAWNIDKKTDDGKPAQGKVGAKKPAYQPNCATTDVSATAEYNLNYDGVACTLSFIIVGSYL